MNNFRKFIQDDSGATAIEYGMIAALISVVIIASVKLIGSNVSNAFGTISSAVAAAS